MGPDEDYEDKLHAYMDIAILMMIIACLLVGMAIVRAFKE